MMTTLYQRIRQACTQLAAAGVESPEWEARELAAWVLGIPRTHLGLCDSFEDTQEDRYEDLIIKRCQRIPLQYLLGYTEFGPVQICVGPGVFIPRPETEALFEWASGCPVGDGGIIVDACTGSGALAAALSAVMPTARVIGIDDSPWALQYARRNCQNRDVELLCKDISERTLLTELAGQVQLVVSNPPYLRTGEPLPEEVRSYEPAHALFGGVQGIDLIIAVVELATRILVSGGWIGIEHDPSCVSQVLGLFEQVENFTQITSRVDWVGRPRFVTACKR